MTSLRYIICVNILASCIVWVKSFGQMQRYPFDIGYNLKGDQNPKTDYNYMISIVEGTSNVPMIINYLYM